jgi:hypothetical protein
MSVIFTLAAGLAWALAQVKQASQDWTNLCQMFARSCVNAAAWASTARRAFEATPLINRHDGTPRGGSLVYFGKPGVDPGHATYAHPDKPGYVFSSDILRKGKIDVVPITLIVNKWGLPYRGWIDSTPSGPLNLTPVPLPVTPTPRPAPIPAPKPASHVIPYPGRPIGIGARGDAVKELQRHLGLPVTGVFTAREKAKVAAHQRLRPKLWNKHTPRWDGIVGPLTYRSITGHK